MHSTRVAKELSIQRVQCRFQCKQQFVFLSHTLRSKPLSICVSAFEGLRCAMKSFLDFLLPSGEETVARFEDVRESANSWILSCEVQCLAKCCEGVSTWGPWDKYLILYYCSLLHFISCHSIWFHVISFKIISIRFSSFHFMSFNLLSFHFGTLV